MTLEEVADLLGVNYQLIYKLVRSGELASLRIGRVYRVTQADFDAYIQKSRNHLSGGICSICGTAHASRWSLKHACPECGEPICVDCWTRKKVRLCPQHAEKSTGGGPAASEPAATPAESHQNQTKGN